MRFRAVGRRLLVLAISGVAACASPPAPVPEGYVFPTWHVGDAGAAALLEGVLVADNGCLYVQPTEGTRYLVVWPDTLRLVLDPSNVAVVMNGTDAAARVGGMIQLGGGEIRAEFHATRCGVSLRWDGLGCHQDHRSAGPVMPQ